MKKILSILIAISLIISMIPAAFAAGESTDMSGVKVTYNLKTFVWNNKANVESDGYSYINYANTNGFYEFAASRHGGGYSWNSFANALKPNSYFAVNQYAGFLAKADESDKWFALKVYVPVAGEYKPSATFYRYTGNKDTSYLEYYLIKVTDDPVSTTLANSNLTSSNPGYIGKKCTYSSDQKSYTEYITGDSGQETVDLDAGEYYLVYRVVVAKGAGWNQFSIGNFTLDGGTNTVPIISSLTVNGNQVTAEAAKMSDNTNASNVTYSYAVADDDADKASVDAETGVVTGKAHGTATIIATATRGDYSSSKSIEVEVPAPAVQEDPTLKAAFDAVPVAENDYVAPTVVGLDFDGTVMDAEDNRNGTFTLTAEATNGKGEKFLYWAVGNTDKKRIISFNNVITNYVPAGEGRNYLIAVYEGDIASDKNEYYNQNGQLIAKDTTDPDLPAMAGYGEAKSWEQYGKTNIYVAQYGEAPKRDEVTVTVVDGNGTATVPFGGSVTCTATRENFKCWKKTNINGDEIVSVDETYTFKAWENCTVTAVYEVHTPLSTAMKIIIDDFDVDSETGIMAEFIGLGSAVEKGIMFKDKETQETTKIAMTTSGNQFTVIADKEGTYTGYAILEDGNAYSIITDGSYTK